MSRPAVAAEEMLGRLLPGWIESATRRRLLARADGDPERLPDVVRHAWDDGELHVDDGLWWSLPEHPVDWTRAALAATPRASVTSETVEAMAALSLAGRPDEALRLSVEATFTALQLSFHPEVGADPARPDPSRTTEPPADSRLGELAMATIFTLIDAGRLHAAEVIARAAHDECIARDRSVGQGWFAAGIGTIELAAGRILDARGSFLEGRLLGRIGRDRDLFVLAESGLLLTYTMVGEEVPELAGPQLAQGATGHPHIAEVRHPGWQARAAAWSDPSPRNLAALARAAKQARSDGQYGIAATLAGELAMLGDPTTAVSLFERFGPLEGDILPLWPRLSRALAAGDLDGMLTIATTLEELGILGLSAALTLRVAALQIRAGSDDEARPVLVEANRRASQVQMGQAYLAHFRRLLPLRDREREIAQLAAVGLTNREIASQLVISIRTVENHLYRVYDKLGIDGRENLAELLPMAASTGS